ncbi:bifunctional 5,10-methylenetetrahydrofolate dehydrogenase/5,10-methenyltetrahydrofolate cyclohydrolase [Metamycoplasma equirhinis]|uniref:bifunctional 5,10-methylenetetrahydrofolate dehydrogenase/5,10-methenyltetrahydrofolate cyclohydrolase n=1 Tax=Metamycoplasma equirhinis TaxID=92402 RepID=UPI0035947757
MYKLLDGKECASKIKNAIKNDISKLAKDEMPILGILQIGNLDESNIYVNSKIKVAKELGISSKLIKLEENCSEAKVIETIEKLSNETTGFIIQLPMQTKKIKNVQKILNLIPSTKDIDGLSEFHLNSNYFKNESFLPATALGIVIMLKQNNIAITNKKIAVIGQSKIVGYPLANYFEQLNNKVARYTIDTPKTTIIENDIVIVATGARNCVTSDMIKNDAIIIDVGIHRINGKIYGDVDFDSCKDKVSYITPVPGGVGPMTIVSLILNLLKSMTFQEKKYKQIFKNLIKIW